MRVFVASVLVAIAFAVLAMPTSRIAIMPLGLTLGFFLIITYVLCVTYGLLEFQQWRPS